MNVYLLHAHDFRYLPYQVAACRKYLPAAARLIAVQGPFGGSGDSPTRLSAAGADELGVCIHTITARLSGGPYARQAAIVGDILATCGPDEVRLILQGDCLPAADLDETSIFAGHARAGRGFMHDERAIVNFTWLCVRGPARIEAGALAGMHCFGASVLDANLHIEHCTPGFWHLDKIGRGDRVADKLKWLIDRVGELPPPRVTDRAEHPPLNVLPPIASEAGRREGICRACDKWDRAKDGCAYLKKCERHDLTRALWQRKSAGGCRLRRWLFCEKSIAPFQFGSEVAIFMLASPKYMHRLELCEATWLDDAAEARQDVTIVSAGRLQTEFAQVQIDAVDRYDHLPQFTAAACRMALENTNWKYLFKCDDDTYISIPRFMRFEPAGRDYIGGSRCCTNGVTYCHGGAGYFLSRKAAAIVAERLAGQTGGEDWWVGKALADAGVYPNFDARFIGTGSAERRPRRDNRIITTHRISEGVWRACHADARLNGPPELPPEAPRARAGRQRMQRQAILAGRGGKL